MSSDAAITFSAASSRRVTQFGDVEFPKCTGAWGTLTHWGIMDASTGGNMLAHGSLTSSLSAVTGMTLTAPDTACYIEVDAGIASDYLSNSIRLFVSRG